MIVNYYRYTQQLVPSLVGSFNLTDNSYVNRNVMGECTAYIEFYSNSALDIQSGDFCILIGKTYLVRDAVIPVRDVTRLKYQLTLYATQYELEKTNFFVFDSTGVDITPLTSWTCNPTELIAQIVLNMNRRQPGMWSAGTVIVGDSKTIDISDNNCFEILEKAAQLWDTHYVVYEHTIGLHYTDRYLTALNLEVGKNKGLREITANKSAESKIVTKLWAYGSDLNSLDGKRLSIDPITVSGATEIVEGIQVFEKIYPRVLSTVTAIRPYDEYYVIEGSGISFDVSDYRISGVQPKITFLSGQLNGLEFFFSITNNGDFAIEYYDISEGVQVPGATGYVPEIGDEFVIWQINIPQSCIDAAKAELAAAANAWLAKNSKQKVKLNIVTDGIYFAVNNINNVECGDTWLVKSDIIPQFFTNTEVKILGYKQYITQPTRYEGIVVGDIYFSRPFAEKVERITKNNNTFKSTVINSDNLAITEQLIGTVDGVNKIFTTSKSFITGSISVFINGNKEDRFTETGPRTVLLDDAPKNTEFTDILTAIYAKR